ncbi:MAG: hypothetical protein H0U06_01370 [Solirubrobacterales bacterium]|nr:hypothetical protein [Solirubrobacterales bacterium]
MGSETFELKRFVWATPDRLEIDGRFVGLGAAPTGRPVLVLRGTERTHRLPAVDDDAPVGEGEDWHAAFAWLEAPTAFGAAELELGDELLVDLPEPVRDADESELDILDVRRRGGTERLRAQSELLAVRSELGEAHVIRERVEKELARAQADVEEERAGRAADAKSFREGLLQAQGAAEETVADALGEIETLRARIAELTSTGAEAERLRTRLSSIRDILADGTGDTRSPGGDGAAP